jgi:hypothetical protein
MVRGPRKRKRNEAAAANGSPRERNARPLGKEDSIVKKSKAKPVDRAQPTIKLPTATDSQRVDVARSTTTSMAKSALWGTSPDVQAAAKAWNLSADAIEANAKIIADLHHQLAVAEAKQLANRRDWRACKRQVLSTVSLVCAGSADDVKGFSLEVITYTVASPLAAVDGITGSPGAKVGEAAWKWPRGLGRHGFLVQHATDVANVATYSPQLACTKTRYTLGGLAPSGSNVSLRVAAVDPHVPTGQGPWSAWVSATVR